MMNRQIRTGGERLCYSPSGPPEITRESSAAGTVRRRTRSSYPPGGGVDRSKSAHECDATAVDTADRLSVVAILWSPPPTPRTHDWVLGPGAHRRHGQELSGAAP